MPSRPSAAIELDPAIIADSPPFAGLGLEDRRELLRNARSSQVARGRPVFGQGEAPLRFFLLLNGHLQVVKLTSDGQQVVVRHVAPGEIFGVAVAMGLAAYPASVVAAEDSVILSWPSAAWPRLVARCPALGANLLQSVGAHLQDAHASVVELATEPVERRIAHALLRLASQAGRAIDSGVEIAFPISRQDIAKMTGSTLHTVSRTLSAWQKDGLVASGRQRIVIRDPRRLRQMAEA